MTVFIELVHHGEEEGEGDGKADGGPDDAQGRHLSPHGKHTGVQVMPGYLYIKNRFKGGSFYVFIYLR